MPSNTFLDVLRLVLFGLCVFFKIFNYFLMFFTWGGFTDPVEGVGFLDISARWQSGAAEGQVPAHWEGRVFVLSYILVTSEQLTHAGLSQVTERFHSEGAGAVTSYRATF